MYQLRSDFFKTVAIMSIALSYSFSSGAQIIGGDLSYNFKRIGNYEVILKVFYSCIGTEPPELQEVVAFETIGHKAIPPLQLRLSIAENKSISTAAVCSQSSTCIKQAIYKGDIELMPVTGGYNITWNSCCILNVLTNISGVSRPGFNLLAYVPGPEIAATNSMPFYNEIPVTNFCLNKASPITCNGTDADGDSLAYELQSPYVVTGNNNRGGNDLLTARSANSLPDPPPFPVVQFADGFTTSEPLGKKGISFEKNGLIQVTMALPGNFLLGYCIKEYRQGKLLSTHQRVTVISVNP